MPQSAAELEPSLQLPVRSTIARLAVLLHAQHTADMSKYSPTDFTGNRLTRCGQPMCSNLDILMLYCQFWSSCSDLYCQRSGMRSHLLFLHIHFHVFDQDTGSIEGPKIGLCGMAIVQGQVLSGWKGGSGLFRTSVGSGAYGRHSTCCIVDCCHRSRRSRSVVNYAQEGDEEAYAGQGDWLAGNGPGKSRRPPDEIDRLIGRVALYVRYVFLFLRVVREIFRQGTVQGQSNENSFSRALLFPRYGAEIQGQLLRMC